jgi:hypothetical protein
MNVVEHIALPQFPIPLSSISPIGARAIESARRLSSKDSAGMRAIPWRALITL